VGDAHVLLGDASTLAELYRPPEGPWVRASMVTSLDGAAVGADGLSKSISTAADQEVFALMRSYADAIVVGAGTVRAERYQPNPKPLVVVSRRGVLPEHLADSTALLATGTAAPGLDAARERLGEDRVVTAGTHGVEPKQLVRVLADRGWSHLLVEGGPSLLADVASAGLVDEWCVTLVPRVVGGEALRILRGADVHGEVRLVSLVEVDGTLMGRWRR
jgi:riboflavin biosynthesis pyrimidine reductase